MEAPETGNLIASSKVQGTAVYNTAGESLGEIDDLMIDKSTGKVAYAIMSFGGFLGIMGNKYHPLPWSVLKYDTGRGDTSSISINISLRAPRPTMRTPSQSGAIEPMRSASTTITARSPTGACNGVDYRPS
jgi:sporulation protein YlmC with PRC-barrel domain